MDTRRPPEPQDGATHRPDRDRYLTRVAIATAAIALLFLAWHIRHALVLVFAGIVVAVILSAVADPVRRWTGMPRPASVLTAGVIIVVVLVSVGWVIMPEVQKQAEEMLSRLPTSLDELDRRMNSWLPEDAMQGGGLVGELAARMAMWSTALFAAITTLVLVIAAGVFLATRPTAYRDGLVSLIAPARQQPLRNALDEAGAAMKDWLRAQLLSMMLIGSAVTLATWLLGLPSPFALGLIAGLLEFVPIIGPIAAAVPALLLALTISPSMVVWTGLTYFLIEQAESNVILPLAQSEVADLPPALLIFAFVALGSVFGIVGIIVSAPLSVALYSLTNELYVKPMNQV